MLYFDKYHTDTSSLLPVKVQQKKNGMKDKILALLLTAFAGVRRDGLNQLATSLAMTVNTDEEATTVVGKLSADQVNKFITDWRKEADAEISRANKSYEDGLKKKYDFVEKKPQEEPAPQNAAASAGSLDAAATAKLFKDMVNEALKPIQERLGRFESEGVGQKRTKELNEKLKDCKDENLKSLVLKNFGRMTFENDEAFSEYLTETSEQISQANQNISDSTLGGQGKPWKSSSTGSTQEASEAEINAVMEKIPM